MDYYRELVKKFHPDALSSASDREKDYAEEVIRVVTESKDNPELLKLLYDAHLSEEQGVLEGIFHKLLALQGFLSKKTAEIPNYIISMSTEKQKILQTCNWLQELIGLKAGDVEIKGAVIQGLNDSQRKVYLKRLKEIEEATIKDENIEIIIQDLKKLTEEISIFHIESSLLPGKSIALPSK